MYINVHVRNEWMNEWMNFWGWGIAIFIEGLYGWVERMLESRMKLKKKWVVGGKVGRNRWMREERTEGKGINGFDWRRQEMVGDRNVALLFGKLLGFAFPSHFPILTFYSQTLGHWKLTS